MAGLDGTKLENVATIAEMLRKNPLLKEWTVVSKNKKGKPLLEICEYKGLIFRIRTIRSKNNKPRKFVRIDGSFHKYRNNNLHNSDDFTCNDAIEVINELITDFDINPCRTAVSNLEFGVNVVLDFPVSLVLDNLIHYKGSLFKEVAKQGMVYYECELSHFIIKIYDKGLQYGLSDNVLRFEVKAMKMQYFKGFNIPIVWLSDLFNLDIYPRLAEVLTTTFDGILFNDNRINVKGLTEKEGNIYYKGSNPNEWKIKTTTEQGKKERQRFRNEFLNLLERERNGIDFRKVVLEKIRSKSFELSLSYQEKNIVTNLTEIAEKLCIVPFLPQVYTVRKGHSENATLRTFTNPKRGKSKRQIQGKCASCRTVLKDGQISYCSLECATQKGGRNGMSNPRNNFKGRYRKLFEEPSLFDLTGLIKLTPQQTAWVKN